MAHYRPTCESSSSRWRPCSPCWRKYVKLKIAGGNVSAQGRLTTGAGTAKSASLRYVGALNIAGLTLNEEDGELFAAWKNVSADKLTASLSPNLLDIPELRVVEANAKLIIENDRSFNAARLLVQPAGADARKPWQRPRRRRRLRTTRSRCASGASAFKTPSWISPTSACGRNSPQRSTS